MQNFPRFVFSLKGCTRNYSSLARGVIRQKPIFSRPPSICRQVSPSRRLFFTSNINNANTPNNSELSATATRFARFTTEPIVAKHLYVIAGLVSAIVVVGGLTRLTESGLSITEWNLVTGTLPPLTTEQWGVELAKYRETPEGRLLNKDIELSDFKKIYLMEYHHRLLGRVIGLAFLLPIPIFIIRKKISPRRLASVLGIGGLIGAQGFLGWYMVQSGLSEELIAAASQSGVPRVSQYRLAAHLGLAFVIYLASLRLGWSIARDWKIVQAIRSSASSSLSTTSTTLSLSGRIFDSPTQAVQFFKSNPVAKKFRIAITALTALTFLTALSGAFVAGLDAGLLYNTFPYMGHDMVTDRPTFSPPRSELLDPRYIRRSTTDDEKKDENKHETAALIWYNIFENPSTVQFDHRVLAVTTFFSTMALALYARRPANRSTLPPSTFKLVNSIFAMATVQASLGISTLIYLVPTSLASAHQTGSLILLTLCVAAGASLRRPHRIIRRYLSSLPSSK